MMGQEIRNKLTDYWKKIKYPRKRAGGLLKMLVWNWNKKPEKRSCQARIY